MFFCLDLSRRLAYKIFKMAMVPPDPIYIFRGGMTSISCVTFKINKTVQRIYAGSQLGNVHIWNLKNKREVGVFKAGEDTCLTICISNEENLIITHTKSGEVSFWEENDCFWVFKKLIKVDYFGFCKCQIFDDTLFVPIKNSKCDLISLKTIEKLQGINLESDNSGDIMAMKVCSVNDKKIMLVAYEGCKLWLWDLNEMKKLSCLQLPECPMAIDYDVGTNKGLCGDPSNEILVFTWDKNFLLRTERKITLTNAGVSAVRIRPDGKLVAVGCWDGNLRLYSWKKYVLLAVLRIHSSTIQDVSFSGNYKEGSKLKYLLAAASEDSRISLWDLYN